MQSWVRVDGCRGTATTQETDVYHQYSFAACRDGASVLYYEIVGGTHGWFNQPKATQLSWAFLLKQARND